MSVPPVRPPSSVGLRLDLRALDDIPCRNPGQRTLAERDERLEHSQTRRTHRYRWLAPLVVIALVGTGIVLASGRGEEMLQGTPELRRPSNWPPIDTAVSDVPLGTPPPVPVETGPFEFMKTHDDGSPVTWDPCRPVRYVINPAGAPPGGEELIHAAVARTSAATGLQFRHEGPTDEVWAEERQPYQPDRYGERWALVVVSWSTADVVPALASDDDGPGRGGDVAGEGGPIAVGLEGGAMVYVTGQVVLDAGDLGPALLRPDGAAAVQAVAQHELGHVVGLGHVPITTELMAESNEGQLDWGPGDLHGLNALGAGDCHPEI